MNAKAKNKSNPVHYTALLLLALTVCLYNTQHYPLVVLHEGFSPDFLVKESDGNLGRQLAFLALGAAGSLGLYFHYKTGQKLQTRLWIVIPIATLLGWCLLSLSWSDMRLIAAKRLIVILLMFLSGLGLAASWTRTQLNKFIVFSSALYLSVGVLEEIAGGYFHPLSGVYRFTGTLTANEQGYLCMALVVSALCFGPTASREEKSALLYYFLAGYGFLFLLLTRSRGALLALGIICILYFFVVLNLRTKIVSILVGCTVGLMATIIGWVPALINVLDRGGEGNENFTGRGPLWTELMGYVQQRPFLGRGYESFWTATTIDDIFKHQHWPINSAHSEYISNMLTIGTIGMVLHTLVLLVGVIAGTRLFRASRDVSMFLLASLCAAYLIGGFLEELLIIKPSIVTYYMILLFCSAGLKAKETQSSIVGQERPFEWIVPLRSKSSVLSATPFDV